MIITPSHASIGKPVHYIDPLTLEHRAAVISAIYEDHTVQITLLSPIDHVTQDPDSQQPGSWHWVERE